MNKYIYRNSEHEILKMSTTFPIVMVTGSRQVGKTTLLNYISDTSKKKINYVTLDDMKIRMLAIEDPELFLETYDVPLIIDEFQYAPNLLSYIKIQVDKKRLECLNNGENPNGMYYLTGSQIFHTMKNVSESLAGRVGIIDLYGLSTREINSSISKVFIPNITNLVNPIPKMKVEKLYQRIFKGSYPALWNNNNIELEAFYETYVRTYIERDIRELINIKDELKFMKFLISAAARTGQELNYASLSVDAGISVPTANEWLSILVNTGLVYLLQPFSTNKIKRLVKSPKLYFMDTGLACYLAGYKDSNTVEKSAFSGAIFETYVVTEIIKSYTNNGLNPKRILSFYRDKLQREIDLIIEYDNDIYPIEIKKSKNPGKESIKNFDVLNKLTNVKPGIVICMMDEIFPIDEHNNFIPIEYI